jgi:O-antigen/teichoic acid export membrane protein
VSSSRSNSISNIYTKVLLHPISFIVSIITARLLGPADRGILGYGMTIISMCILVLTFGLGLGMYYQLSTKKYEIRNVLVTVLVLGGLFGVVISLFVWIIYIVGVIPIFSSLSKVQIVLVFAIIIFGICHLFLNKVLVSNALFKLDNIVKLIVGILQPLFLLMMVWYFTLGVTGALLASAIVGLIGILFSLKIVHDQFGPFRLSFDRSFVKDSWSYGIKSWLGDVTQMANLRLDQIILGFYVPVYQLGIYTVAVTLTELAWIVPNSVSGVLMNKIASTEGAIEYKIDLAGKICKGLLAFTLCFSVVLYLVVKHLILPCGYGQAFTGSITPFIWLLPGAISLIYAKVITKILTGLGYVADTTKAILIGAIINITLYFVFIPKYGIVGAAAASSFGYLSVSSACLFMLKRRFSLQFASFVSWSLEDIRWMKVQGIGIIRSVFQRSTL